MYNNIQLRNQNMFEMNDDDVEHELHNHSCDISGSAKA